MAAWCSGFTLARSLNHHFLLIDEQANTSSGEHSETWFCPTASLMPGKRLKQSMLDDV